MADCSKCRWTCKDKYENCTRYSREIDSKYHNEQRRKDFYKSMKSKPGDRNWRK